MPSAPIPFESLVSRSMIFTGTDGTTSEIFIDIGIPFLVPNDDPAIDPVWACQYRTRGFTRDELLTLYGADGIQALYLALQMAGVRIAAQPEAKSLDWVRVTNFGFPPVAPPL